MTKSVSNREGNNTTEVPKFSCHCMSISPFHHYGWNSQAAVKRNVKSHRDECWNTDLFV